MPSMKLLMHIGLHKTGTSAIQSFLLDNRAQLLAQGLLYPLDLEKWGNHNPLAWHLMDPRYLPTQGDFYRKLSTPAHWQKLHEAVSESRADRVILSGEDFSLIGRPQQLAALLERYETRVIVYLRRQDQYLQSIYNQDVKNYEFMRHERFEDFVLDHRLEEILHYDVFLERWSAAFGKENIVVGIYDRGCLKDGLIPDFASLAGIDLRQDMRVRQEAVNTRLSDRALEVKRMLNRLKLNEPQHRILLDALINTPLAQLQSASLPAEHSMMSRHRQREFLRQFCQGNRAVARDYLGVDGDPFSEPGDGSGHERPSPAALPESETLMNDLVAPMIQNLFMHLEQLLETNTRLHEENCKAGEIWQQQQSWISHLERKLREAGILF
jgi:hypothetical protein